MKTNADIDYKDEIYLIAQLKLGDEKAFTYLIDKHHNSLCVYANSFLKDTLQSEDVVQAVFIKVWEKREYFNEYNSIKSYLYKSVYHELIDQYRKSSAKKKLEEKYSVGLEVIVDESESEDFQQLIKMIDNELENMPTKQKNIFTLSKKDGLTNKEISEYLNISVKAVEAQITKAFAALRKKLKANY